jgi:hypothetical protein
MELLTGVEKEGLGKHERIMDSQNKRHASVEDDEKNLAVVTVSIGTPEMVRNTRRR